MWQGLGQWLHEQNAQQVAAVQQQQAETRAAAEAQNEFMAQWQQNLLGHLQDQTSQHMAALAAAALDRKSVV